MWKEDEWVRKILVTAISGDIGNGILKILKSEDHILYGCDVNEIAVGMDMVQQFWQSKFAVEEGYIEDLLEKCCQYGITHLIPVNEREIEVIGRARERFEEIDVKLVIQSEKMLDICLDKYATMRFLEDHGFDIPATYVNKDEIDNRNISYICKPRKSNGSKGIFVFSFQEQITDNLKEDCLIQEYIESEEEYTAGVFRDKDVVNCIVFLRQLKDGYSSQVELTEDQEIHHIARKIALLMDLEGYINIQLRKKGEKYFIFEINPRISGTVRFRHMLGFKDVLWWLDMLDGRKVESYKNIYRRALGVRELNEKYLVLEHI